ncbi:MAG: toll/interleukin-1 receptor domain-containing protein [Roseiarcus sp.]
MPRREGSAKTRRGAIGPYGAPASHGGGIFVSYRREDSAGFAGRLYDRLTTRLDRDHVFIDVDNIEPGVDFVEVLSERVGACDVLVAVIGKNWLSCLDASGRRRLDDPHDFVRVEIEAALQRSIRVIPALVDGATMPREDELPGGLKPLSRRNAIEISHTRFDMDADRLARALAQVEEARKKREAEEAARRAKEQEEREASAEAAARGAEQRRRAAEIEAARVAREERRKGEAEGVAEAPASESPEPPVAAQSAPARPTSVAMPESPGRPFVKTTVALAAAAAIGAIVLVAGPLHGWLKPTSPEEQFDMGMAYEQGDGVEKDVVKAFDWYLRAARQGLPIAQIEVGLDYENGNGVEKDVAKALAWYRKAAEQGYEPAMTALKRLGAK